jgi:predicted enzyme related to lactoylglutathione lyase
VRVKSGVGVGWDDRVMSDDQPVLTDQRRYPHGVPSWVDVTQPDLDAAARFYGGLFGWQLTDVTSPDAPGSYLIATLDGHDVAAVAPVEAAREVGWRTYVACDDVDTTAAAVTAAGGRVLAAPRDVGPAGRDATCIDPQGAQFRLWQARRRLGVQLANSPGAWNFSILRSAAPGGVLPFYAVVFGWAVDPQLGAGMVRLPGYGDHLAATVDPHIHERQQFAPPGFADVVAGVVEDADAEQAEWQVTFTVADRDESAATAERLGATVLSSSENEWTREAVIRDPQGATLTLSQFAPAER